MPLPHSRKKGKKYQNPVPTETGVNKLWPVLKEYLYHSGHNKPEQPLGPFYTDAHVYQQPPQSGLRVTWLGHATLLIEIDGNRFLTDPVWSQRVSFAQWIGPKRYLQPPLPLKDLPKLDAVILSHDHYDHLDKATVKYLAGIGVPFICTLGVGKYLKDWSVAPHLITEMDWSDSISAGRNCTITATPARHFSGRGLTNRDETLWASYVIKGTQHNIYFGGDSGWFEGYHDIGNIYGPFDLTILGIGAYGKYWPDIHTTPAEALEANEALKGKLMLPIHWGTFPLAPHPWYEPAEKLISLAASQHQILLMPEPGKPIEATHELIEQWWKPFI